MKLLGNNKGPSQIVTGFSKAMMQAFLHEYLGEHNLQYLSRMFRITKEIIHNEENKTARLHIYSFLFLKLNKDFIKYDRKTYKSKLYLSLHPWRDLSVVTTLIKT